MEANFACFRNKFFEMVEIKITWSLTFVKEETKVYKLLNIFFLDDINIYFMFNY